MMFAVASWRVPRLNQDYSGDFGEERDPAAERIAALIQMQLVDARRGRRENASATSTTGRD